MDRDSSEEKRPFLQRRYLIDRRFQIKYTLMVVILSSIVFLIFGYRLYRGELAKTQILQIQNLDVQNLVQSQDTTILYYLAAFFLLQLASLVVLGILITHRIAGPVFRVQKYLEDAAKGGELKTLDKVRSRDEFHEFFDSLSELIDRFKAKTDVQKAKVDELKHALDKARNDVAQIDRCKALCNELLSIL